MHFSMQGLWADPWAWWGWYTHFSKYIFNVLLYFSLRKSMTQAIVKLLKVNPKATLKDAIYIARQVLYQISCNNALILLSLSIFRDNAKEIFQAASPFLPPEECKSNPQVCLLAFYHSWHCWLMNDSLQAMIPLCVSSLSYTYVSSIQLFAYLDLKGH